MAEADDGANAAVAEPLVRWPKLRASQRRVVRDLIIHGPQSRTELARKLALSRTSLSRFTQELDALGLIHDGETVRAATPGRPQELVQIRPDAAYFHGVEVTNGRIHGVTIDLTASVQGHHLEVLETNDPERVTERIVAVHEMLSSQGPHAIGLGIAVPGLVQQGQVARSDRLGWQDVPLQALLAPHLDVPVTVVNETVALTGAHQWFGAARGHQSLVLFAIGPEIEAGVAVFDELMDGTYGRAGRVSHTRLDGSGLPCARGHTDCIHSFVTKDAIAHNAGYAPEDYARVAELARYNVPTAVEAFDAAATALGMAIAEAVNLLDPETVLVTGEASDVMDISTDRLYSSLTDHLDSTPVEALDLRRPGFRYSQYAQGAAVAAILDLFREVDGR
jgi:predicted NBD/HSP70 family sugar kinase